MKLRLKILFFLLLCGGLFSLYKLFLVEYVKIDSIHFVFPQQTESMETLPPDKRERLLSLVEKYKNRSIWSVSLKEMALEVQKNHPSKKARVKRRLPNKIEIYLEDSLPAFLILTEKGRFHPVSFEGVLGAALSPYELLDLPIARGDLFKTDERLRAQTVQLLKTLPGKDILSPENISEIIYTPERESFTLFLIPHYFVLEVKTPWRKKQIQNINFVLNYLIQKEEKVARIDARFPEKIIVRRD